MGFSWEEYWSGLLFPTPGGLQNPGIEPGSPARRPGPGGLLSGVRAEWAAGKDCQLGRSEVFFFQVWESVCTCVRGGEGGGGEEKGLQCCLS